MPLRTVFSTWSRIFSRAVPEGMWPLVALESRISSTVTVHFLRALLRGRSKYVAVAPDGGSTEVRALGRGVVLRLRGAAEAFAPGFALPLLLVVGAITGGVAVWSAGGCGGVASTVDRRRVRAVRYHIQCL
jgi:hypothetical protein